MQIETDVLIVGSGPAGSIAAKELAKNGIRVYLVDKKSEIGTPKRCAEGILRSTLDELDIKYNQQWISWKINGIKIVAPDKNFLTFSEDNFNLPDKGYILERKVFDKHLTMEAIRYGAKTLIKTEVTDIQRTNTGFLVTAHNFHEKLVIKTKILIAADGPESRVARMAGLKTNTSLKDMASCIQYEMINVKTDNMSHVEVHVGSIVPGGYIWIFPKSDDSANVGLGILKSYTDKTAKYFLDKFVESNEKLKDAQIVAMNVGGDPLGGLIEERYSDNIMVIGDAAGFVDPLTGDGIRTAMLSGKYAGIVATKAIKNNDCSAKAFKEYYDMSQEKIGKSFNKYNKIKEFLLTLDDKSLDKIVENISKSELNDLNVTDLLKIVIKSSPKSILNLTKLL